MSNLFLHNLANGPMLDPARPHVPGGKKAKPAGAASEQERQAAKGERHAKRAAEIDRYKRKAETLLAHYAASEAPLATVRDYIGADTILFILRATGGLKRKADNEEKQAAIVQFIVAGLARHGRRLDPADA